MKLNSARQNNWLRKCEANRRANRCFVRCYNNKPPTHTHTHTCPGSPLAHVPLSPGRQSSLANLMDLTHTHTHTFVCIYIPHGYMYICRRANESNSADGPHRSVMRGIFVAVLRNEEKQQHSTKRGKNLMIDPHTPFFLYVLST